MPRASADAARAERAAVLRAELAQLESECEQEGVRSAAFTPAASVEATTAEATTAATPAATASATATTAASASSSSGTHINAGAHITNFTMITNQVINNNNSAPIRRTRKRKATQEQSVVWLAVQDRLDARDHTDYRASLGVIARRGVAEKQRPLIEHQTNRFCLGKTYHENNVSAHATGGTGGFTFLIGTDNLSFPAARPCLCSSCQRLEQEQGQQQEETRRAQRAPTAGHLLLECASQGSQVQIRPHRAADNNQDVLLAAAQKNRQFTRYCYTPPAYAIAM